MCDLFASWGKLIAQMESFACSIDSKQGAGAAALGLISIDSVVGGFGCMFEWIARWKGHSSYHNTHNTPTHASIAPCVWVSLWAHDERICCCCCCPCLRCAMS